MSTEPSNQHANAKDPAWYARAAAQPEPEHRPAAFQRLLLAEVFAHARECYPEECCGLMLGPPGAEPRQVVRCTNVQNVRLAKGESSLNSSQGFWIDEQELERALRSAEARGEDGRLVVRLDGPAERGCQQVIVIDMDDGKVLGRVQATPQP